MDNVEMAVEGDILTVMIDLSKRGVVSKSGKSLMVGSTLGIVKIPGNKEVSIGLNCFVAAPKSPN